jgi:hypothetical protein
MAEDKPSLTPEDYAAIEAAVMETSRGRWFLAEYARRNRQADTVVLLEALQRIESAMASAPRSVGDSGRLRSDVGEIADALTRAKRDLATSIADAAGPGQPASVERAFDDMVRIAETADSEVFAIAEHLQEIGWSLREAGEVAEACAEIERQALELYRVSNRHALTTNRVRSLVAVLRMLETRVGGRGNGMGGGLRRITPGHRLGGEAQPHRCGSARIRDDIVFVESREGRDLRDRAVRRPPPTVSAPVTSPPAAKRELPDDPRLRAFAAIDALSPQQKLALFA